MKKKKSNSLYLNIRKIKKNGVKQKNKISTDSFFLPFAKKTFNINKEISYNNYENSNFYKSRLNKILKFHKDNILKPKISLIKNKINYLSLQTNKNKSSDIIKENLPLFYESKNIFFKSKKKKNPKHYKINKKKIIFNIKPNNNTFILKKNIQIDKKKLVLFNIKIENKYFPIEVNIKPFNKLNKEASSKIYFNNSKEKIKKFRVHFFKIENEDDININKISLDIKFYEVLNVAIIIKFNNFEQNKKNLDLKNKKYLKRHLLLKSLFLKNETENFCNEKVQRRNLSCDKFHFVNKNKNIISKKDYFFIIKKKFNERRDYSQKVLKKQKKIKIFENYQKRILQKRKLVKIYNVI